MSEIEEINTNDFEGFFFKAGQEAFNALVKFAKKNKINTVLIDTILNSLKERKSSFSDWIKEQENSDNKDLILHINKFVSYCDVNASSTDSNKNAFQEDNQNIKEDLKTINNSNNLPNKLSIAKAFVRQNTWVKNILIYLKGGEVSPSVKNAIEYFKKPKNRFPILSEGHRQKIREHYKLDETWNNIPKEDKKKEFDFDKTLIVYINNCMQEVKQKYKDIGDSNLTYAYSVEIYKHRSEWDLYTTLLEKNHNLILTGAPGTGKTYLAIQMAKKLTNTKDEKEIEKNPYIGFVQFHPSYDYTDFVEGLRPKADNGNVVFERVNGVFKEFCKKAIENEKDKKEDNKNKYVFIIDEINRGEISKIFGELFFSIDPGYRGEKGKVKTQYQNMIDKKGKDTFKEGFYVPKNVYIIGTMNDIDRSVESMDFAFRRRFAFQEITAKESMERILYDLDDSISGIAAEKMGAINKTLNELGLNSNYHIGGAYFMKALNYLGKNNKATNDTWNQLWNLHLKGTLFEYFRGEPDADNKIKQLKEAYDKAENNK